MCWNLSEENFVRASHGAEVVLKNKTVPFWSVPLHAAAVEPVTSINVHLTRTVAED